VNVIKRMWALSSLGYFAIVGMRIYQGQDHYDPLIMATLCLIAAEVV
jgi:hypothetical protein